MGTTEPKRCLGCGYILEHLPEPRCPECGRQFDPNDAATYSFADQRERLLAVRWIILSASAPALPVIASFAVTAVDEQAAFVVVRLLMVANVLAQAIVFVRSMVALLRTPRTVDRIGWGCAMALSLLFLVGCGGCLATSRVLWTRELPP
jgi:uncharacterized paraquat-inducible protein A